MSRADQAIAMLRENRSKGLNLYESRQILVQKGFSNLEIDDATDKLDSETAAEQTPQAGTASSLEQVETDQLGPTATPEVESPPLKNVAAWYIGFRLRGFILISSFFVVFAAGNFYTKHHSPLRLILYFAALGLSVLTAIYLNIVMNIRSVSGKNQRLVAGAVGAVACIICFVFLWFVSISVLR